MATTYINRTMEKTLNEYIGKYPVIMITGPRQVGKTTLLNYMKENSKDKINYVTLDDMINMNFQPNSEQSQPKFEPFQNMNLNNNMNFNPQVDDEEQKRIEAREKEAMERREKINQKIQKEEELRSQILKKASEYMLEFEQNRQELIAKRRKALEEKNNNINQDKGPQNNADSWGRVNSNIDLKDSEYKGSKDVQRMREAMLNRTNDSNSEPMKNFFG